MTATQALRLQGNEGVSSILFSRLMSKNGKTTMQKVC